MSPRLLPLLLSAWPLTVSAGFVGLDLPGSQLNALSRDGRTAAGSLIGGASGGFRWREGGRVELLKGAVSARAISASGRYVAGSALDAGQREVAARWDADGSLQRMDGLDGATAAGGVLGVAFGVSDGGVAVGAATAADGRSAAFRWQPPALPELLPAAAETSSRAVGIGGDGSRIYGWSETAAAARRAVVWPRPAGAPLDLAAAGEVIGASRSGDLLLGISRRDDGATQAWRWSEGTGLTPLAAAAAQPLQMMASDDAGSLLAGSSGHGAGRTAAIWTAAGGVQPLQRFLTDRHVEVPAGWTLMAATAVSADGRRIGGWGQHGGRFDSFVVELPVAGDAHDPPQQHRSDVQPGETTR
jgi:uncharacterized membrane protein